MLTVLVPLAEGCEELEAVTIIDLLRRAQVEVVTAGLAAGPVKASRGTVLVPDTTLDAALQADYDLIALPGGLPGADHLANDARLIAALQKTAARGQYTAAICAAPRALAKAGLLAGKRFTAYPGSMKAEDYPGLTPTGAVVEQNGGVITSRGPGTAMDFALTLIEVLCGRTTRDTVEKGLVRP